MYIKTKINNQGVKQELVTTKPSFLFDPANNASVPTDVSFYVSGSSSDKSMFGGPVYVSGTLTVSSSISGSIQTLADGVTPYLLAGSGVTITSASNGQVTISSTGAATAGGMDTEIQFNKTNSLSGSSHLKFDYSSYTLSLSGSFDITGSITPDLDFTRNLGTPDIRWKNVYTGDLHLRNDRGDWTIVEERDFLCVVNNITGKRYKMALEPLED